MAINLDKEEIESKIIWDQMSETYTLPKNAGLIFEHYDAGEYEQISIKNEEIKLRTGSQGGLDKVSFAQMIQKTLRVFLLNGVAYAFLQGKLNRLSQGELQNFCLDYFAEDEPSTFNSQRMKMISNNSKILKLRKNIIGFNNGIEFDLKTGEELFNKESYVASVQFNCDYIPEPEFDVEQIKMWRDYVDYCFGKENRYNIDKVFSTVLWGEDFILKNRKVVFNVTNGGNGRSHIINRLRGLRTIQQASSLWKTSANGKFQGGAELVTATHNLIDDSKNLTISGDWVKDLTLEEFKVKLINENEQLVKATTQSLVFVNTFKWEIDTKSFAEADRIDWIEIMDSKPFDDWNKKDYFSANFNYGWLVNYLFQWYLENKDNMKFSDISVLNNINKGANEELEDIINSRENWNFMDLWKEAKKNDKNIKQKNLAEKLKLINYEDFETTSLGHLNSKNNYGKFNISRKATPEDLMLPIDATIEKAQSLDSEIIDSINAHFEPFNDYMVGMTKQVKGNTVPNWNKEMQKWDITQKTNQLIETLNSKSGSWLLFNKDYLVYDFDMIPQKIYTQLSNFLHFRTSKGIHLIVKETSDVTTGTFKLFKDGKELINGDKRGKNQAVIYTKGNLRGNTMMQHKDLLDLFKKEGLEQREKKVKKSNPKTTSFQGNIQDILNWDIRMSGLSGNEILAIDQEGQNWHWNTWNLLEVLLDQGVSEEQTKDILLTNDYNSSWDEFDKWFNEKIEQYNKEK